MHLAADVFDLARCTCYPMLGASFFLRGDERLTRPSTNKAAIRSAAALSDNSAVSTKKGKWIIVLAQCHWPVAIDLAAKNHA